MPERRNYTVNLPKKSTGDKVDNFVSQKPETAGNRLPQGSTLKISGRMDGAVAMNGTKSTEKIGQQVLPLNDHIMVSKSKQKENVSASVSESSLDTEKEEEVNQSVAIEKNKNEDLKEALKESPAKLAEQARQLMEGMFGDLKVRNINKVEEAKRLYELAKQEEEEEEEVTSPKTNSSGRLFRNFSLKMGQALKTVNHETLGLKGSN